MADLCHDLFGVGGRQSVSRGFWTASGADAFLNGAVFNKVKMLGPGVAGLETFASHLSKGTENGKNRLCQ